LICDFGCDPCCTQSEVQRPARTALPNVVRVVLAQAVLKSEQVTAVLRKRDSADLNAEDAEDAEVDLRSFKIFEAGVLLFLNYVAQI
jgi:hypothetical protein